MGSQWQGIGEGLQHLPIFMDSIYKSDELLKEIGIDLIEILKIDSKAIDETINSLIAITATQIALIDLFRELDIIPDGFIGHSLGEVACAYCDGCMDRKQTLLATYWRARLVTEADLPKGLMAAVGLSVDDCEKRCPEGVFVGCHNSKDSVTISGEFEVTSKFIEQLTREQIFAKKVNSCGIPFHCPLIDTVLKPLLEKTREIIPKPLTRSSKWISSCVPESDWNTDLAKYCSPEYFEYNMLSPVLFNEALQLVPRNAVLIELGPTSLFESIIKRSLGNDIKYINLMKKNNSSGNLEMILSSIGRLYQLGFNPDIDKLYPLVTYPVSRRTPSLSPLIQWNHSDDWFVPLYPEYFNRENKYVYKVAIDLELDENAFYTDHRLQDKIIFPATGYIVMIWEMLAKNVGKKIDECPIELENLKIHRAKMLDDNDKITFSIEIESNKKIIIKNNNVVVFSTIYNYIDDVVENDDKLRKLLDIEDRSSDSFVFESKDLYEEFSRRGYDYGIEFQKIRQATFDGSRAKLAFNGNWVTFLDSMCQLNILNKNLRLLYMPISIQSIRIHPRIFYQLIEYHGTETVIDVTQDLSRKSIKIGEIIEIINMEMKLAKYKSQDCVVEKYQFVPNIDKIRSRKLDKLVELSTRLTLKIIKNLTISEYNQFKTVSNCLNENLNSDLISNSKNGHLLIQLLQGNFNKSNLVITLKNFLAYNCIDFMITEQIYCEEIVIRPLIDIIIENKTSRSFNVMELELSHNNYVINAIKSVIDNTNKHLKTNYKLLFNENDKNYVNILDNTIEKISWNLARRKKLKSSQTNNLVLINLTNMIDKNIDINMMLDILNGTCENNCFAMLFVRTSVLPCERLIHYLLDLKLKENDLKFIIGLLTSNGWSIIAERSCRNIFSIFLFRKLKLELIQNRNLVKINENSYKFIDLLKNKLEHYQKTNEKENIWLLANGSQHNGIMGKVVLVLNGREMALC